MSVVGPKEETTPHKSKKPLDGELFDLVRGDHLDRYHGVVIAFIQGNTRNWKAPKFLTKSSAHAAASSTDFSMPPGGYTNF